MKKRINGIETCETVPVPCGRCPNCCKRRISHWSFRLMQEDKKSSQSHFITLTYETPPISRNGFMSLRKKDCQDFFKRLRYYEKDNTRIKYYLCGEYGGKTQRPHYHFIIFNCGTDNISKAWELGHVHFGKVSAASVGYTCKYMAKPSKIPMHRNDDRVPEFSLMSKGLGLDYLTPQMIKWHKDDLENRMYCVLRDGKKISMPRYYKDKMYSELDKKKLANKFKWQTLKEPEVDSREKVQSDLAAFRKMFYNALKNRQLL